jgi:hypothetical protein
MVIGSNSVGIQVLSWSMTQPMPLQRDIQLVVIDEIHRAPGLFEILRGIIDDRRASGDRAGHFLLLGSAALELMQQASETLAGRVAYLDLAGIDAEWARQTLPSGRRFGSSPDPNRPDAQAGESTASSGGPP